MADISKIKVDDIEYDVKDTVARQNIDTVQKEMTTNYFKYLGKNPIVSTSDDTPMKWKDIGSGYAYITSGKLNNQPGEYGVLVQYVYADIICQEFYSVVAGQHYYRNGNGTSGWWADADDNGTWRKLLDSSDN